MTPPRVAIIGAGLAGLCCAKKLLDQGVVPAVFEASDSVGGRVRTDIVDGFRLDRGFQVFLTAYPEGKHFLDFPSLDLRAFEPGSLIKLPNQAPLVSLHDALRKPSELLATLFSPAATLGDKVRTVQLKYTLKSSADSDILSAKQTTTLDRLRAFGFSDRVIASFFRPFFSGVFLKRDLSTSSRAFDFTFKMFASGKAVVPALGMQAIPEQIASKLPANVVRLNTPVAMINNRLLVTEAGESKTFDAIVIATDHRSAHRLAPVYVEEPRNFSACTTMAFAVSGANPIGRAAVVLFAGDGVVCNAVSMTDVTRSYSPDARHLIYVNLVGDADETIQQRAMAELADAFGSAVADWKLLRVYRIPYALPDQSVAAMSEVHKRVRLNRGLYLCGDHVDQASINGAMCAGRRAAEAIAQDFGLGET